MAKQLNVNLAFSADTTQAKAQIQALSKSLQEVAKMPGNASSLFDDTAIRKASQAALELEQHLSKAVNVDTGKLDLSRFSTSLKASNKSLNSYCNTLLSTGEKGQQAFLKLAQAIATADAPVTRVNKKLAEMGTTLKNTARWQLSSSILHGFMGTLQSAYGYAQDLNSSLNNIRIVTGQNIDQMARFAEEANKAAKSLSTTTTQYTDASLIFYQQGLSDSEVQKRTEVTIKMANAAGQSAQIISDQLTSVWNNFYDGSKSLEYYADVMTALGAATASSTDEIAGGLEKFAAIGQTIGLSYEYAASALATITSNTRQSEEVVGTALKTIFARIQGLNLGETLDDGTTLNKYSKALDSVGISIFNQAGELKNMDSILDEMAEKWDTLSRAQQVALAQTVAGTRQYTQLVALMENWDNGDNDSMTANLETSYGASGALQKQADIYAESWEAAQERVQAAAEGIYQDLLDDEFFIKLLNAFERVLTTVDSMIDGFGGLGGVLNFVGSIFLQHYAKKMPETLNNLRQNLMVFTGQANKEMQKVQSDLGMSIKTAQATPGVSSEYKIQLEGIAQVNAMKQKLTLASKNLTSQEILEYEAKIKNVQAMYDEVAALTAKAEALKKAEDASSKQAMKSAQKSSDGLFSAYQSARQSRDASEQHAAAPGATAEQITAYTNEAAKAQTEMDALEQKIKDLAEAADLTEHEMRAMMAGPEAASKNAKVLENMQKGQQKVKKAIADTTAEMQKQVKKRSNLNNLSISIKSQASAWKDVGKEITSAVKEHNNLKGAEKTTESLKEKMTQYLEVLKRIADESEMALDEDYVKDLSSAISNMDASNVEEVTAAFADFAAAVSTDADNDVKRLDSSIGSLQQKMNGLQFNESEIDQLEQNADEAANAVQNLDNAMDNIKGSAEESFGGEFKPSVALTEFASTAMSVYGAITSLKNAFSTFGDEEATGLEKVGAALSALMAVTQSYSAVMQLVTTLQKSDTASKLLNAAASKVAALFGITLTGAKTTETGAVAANTAAWYANPIMWIALIIVGVVAALVGLIAIIGAVSKALSDSYNADAIAAENAEKAAENLAKRYEDVKASYEEMISAMENYQSARDALSELTKGTAEYEEALQKANNAALELIQNYPEHFNAGDYTWQDGELIISDQAMADAKEAENKKVQDAFAASTMANAGAKQARAIANATETKRSQRDEMGIGDGDLIAQGVVTAIGSSLLPGLGPIFGQAIGGALLGNNIQKAADYDAAVDEAMKLYVDDANLFSNQAYLAEKMAEVGVTNDELIQALWDNREGLDQLGQEFSQASLAMKVAAENVANTLVMDNEAVQKAESKGQVDADDVAAVTAKSYQNKYEEELEKAQADIESRGLFNTGTQEAKDLMAEYAKISGLDQDSNFEVTNYVGDGSVKVKKTLDDGSVEEVTLTAAEIAATVAAERANQFANQSLETVLADMMAFSAEDATAEERGLKDFLTTGKLDDASQEELQAIQSKVIVEGDGTIFGDLKAVEQTALNLQNTLTGSPEDYGYDTWMEMAEALADAAEKTEEAWDTIELPEGLENTGDLSLSAAKKIQEDSEWIAAGSQGEAGVETYVKGINQLTEAMGEAEKAEFMERIGDVDWSDWYAMDDVTALLEELDVDLNMTTEDLEAFTNAMRIAGGASPVQMLQQTKENIEALGATLSEGIAPGSVLDEETYASLIEANKELEDQFMKTIDGSYKYVGGDTLGLEQLDMGEYLDTTREMHDLYENAKEAAGDIDFEGLSTVDYTFADEMALHEKALEDAKDQLDAAEEAAEGLHPIKYKELEAAVDAADAAVDSAQDNIDKLDEANLKVQEQLSSSIGSILADENLMAVAEYSNYTKEQLEEMQANVAAGDEEAIKQAQELHRQMNIFMAAGANGEYDIGEAEEQIASTATSIEELDKLTDEYKLSAETYAKAISGLFYTAAAEAETIEELDEILKKVQDAGGEIDMDVYLENVKRLSEESMNAADSMDALAQAKYEAESRGAEVDPELYTENIKRIAEESVNAASSIAELKEAWGKALATGTELDTSAYNEKLIELGSAYENCADEVRAFEQALLSNDPALVEEAKSLLEVAVELNELAEAYGLDAEATANYADRLADGNATTADAKRAYSQMAIAAQRLDRGVKNINENLDDYKKVLKTANRDSFEFSETMDELKTNIADMFNVADGNMFSDTFAEGLLDSEDFQKALNGDVEALDRLRASATVDLGDNIIADLGDAADTIHYKLDEAGNQIAGSAYSASSAWDYVRSVLADGFTMEEINNEQFVNSLNDMIAASGMTKEQIQSMLGSMGVSAEVVTDYKEMETEVPTYYEHSEEVGDTPFTYTDFDGTVVTSSRPVIRKMTIPGPPVKTMGYVPTYSIKTTSGDTTSGGEIDYSNTFTKASPPAISSSSSSAGKNSGGGGGNSKKTSDSRQKKSDVVERYKEVNDQLEKTNHLMSKNSTLAEGLWGEARSKKMRDNIELQKKENELLKEKLAETESYLALDRADLSGAAAALGVSLDYDEAGAVTNIESVQAKLWAEREALLDSFGAEIDEEEQVILDTFDEKMEAFTSAYDLYESTRQENMATEEELLAGQLEAQQMMFDELNQSLEENISLIEKDLELVEYYLSKVEDDFFGMAEAAALMVGSLSSANPGEGGQLGGYLDILAEQKRHKEELDAAYAAGDINQAQYIQGLMDCQSAIIEQLQNINELDKTMKGYYGETLTAAQEELSKYTDMMEHHSEVLEHYSSLLELIGASKDWERMKTVLEAQVSVAENAAAVSKANYEMLAQEAADKKAAWDALGKGLGDELTYEESVIKQQWLDAQAAADEAQNQMLEDAEAWAESLKSLLETELAELADILNESLSGEFGSLDNMMTVMERANSLQEEYLTTTNQVYETNKLMHTAQQEIDKTTNSVAKRRLKQYIDETEQLQNKNKLSQFELDIQKAKYDLLVAEIALEEAQQAKSTVRLQRDSEGNFGYVYTADQNAVADAEQELADAQNALYNIGLEGANKYAENYAQTIQEMNDAVTELTEQWQNGEIGSKEEYQQRMLELEEYYGEKLMQYSELHSIALQTDSRVAADAWTRDFAHMTTQTQRWMQNVDVYVQGVEASMDRYQQGIDRVEEYAGLDLDSLKTKTQNIKDENKALAKSITEKDGLLDAIKDEITEVDNLTTSYANLRTEIQGTVDDYEDLLRRMGVEIDTAAAGNPPFSGGDTEDPNTGGDDPGTGGNIGDPDTGGDDPGDTGAKTISVGGKVNASGAQIYDYAGDTSGEHQYFSSDPVYKVLKESGDWIQVRHHKLSSGITGWFKKSDVTAMNTGGYTGDWAGSYGKLAFLHQKELVLNAKDTENLLASMDILDKIISTIDLYSSSAQLGGMLSSPRYGGFDNEPLEQNVHIEASFPSVTDHNEIEDALNNLINRASQYAHRK